MERSHPSHCQNTWYAQIRFVRMSIAKRIELKNANLTWPVSQYLRIPWQYLDNFNSLLNVFIPFFCLSRNGVLSLDLIWWQILPGTEFRIRKCLVLELSGFCLLSWTAQIGARCPNSHRHDWASVLSVSFLFARQRLCWSGCGSYLGWSSEHKWPGCQNCTSYHFRAARCSTHINGSTRWAGSTSSEQVLNDSKCSNKRHRIHSAQWPWVISIQRNWKQTGTSCANWRDYREKQQFRERCETKMHPRHMSLVLIGFVRIGKSSVQVPPLKPIHSFCLFCQQQREKMRGKQGKHIYIMH